VEKHRQLIPHALLDAQPAIDALAARLDALHTPQVLCHGDPCPANCLRLKDGSLRLIDWEQAGMADPLVDIAVAAVNLGLEEEAESRLEQYLQRNPSSQELFRLHASIALDYFAWAWWSLQLGEDEECRYYYEKGMEYMCAIS
jgi:thiamine kinase-like enzyme